MSVVACPCECGRRIHDPYGYFVGMTLYAAATLDLLDHCRDVTDDPALEARVDEIRLDTNAIIELLLEWCHDELDLIGATRVHAISILWEKAFEAMAPVFERIDAEFYRRWLGETTPQRARRHGIPQDDPLEIEIPSLLAEIPV